MAAEAVESPESSDQAKPEPTAEAPAPPAEPAPPTIRMTDLEAAVGGCGDAESPAEFTSCLGRELEARGYQLEAATEASAPVAGTAAEATAQPAEATGEAAPAS